MSGPDDWYWPELIAPFTSVLGPLERTAAILGGCDACAGRYGDAAVWLVWHRTDGTSTPSSTLTIAASAGGHPMMGHIVASDRFREQQAVPPDGVFFEYFDVKMSPSEIVIGALGEAETRARVERCFRKGGPGSIVLQDGFVRTSAEFHAPSPFGWGSGPHRPPSPAEAAALVDDVVYFAARFRHAYEAYFNELLRTQGPAAAQAWDARARGAVEYERRRTRKVKLVFGAILVLFCLAMLASTLVCTGLFMSLLGGIPGIQ